MSTFMDGYAKVNPPTITDNAVAIPRIWWMNGAKQAKTPGVFYAKALEHPGEFPDGWTEAERFQGETGYETAQLVCALVGWRMQAFNEVDGARGKERVWLPEYKPGAKLYTEWLVMVDGLDYPCVICSKGLTGKALGVARKEFATRVLGPAAKLAGRPMVPWSFWMQLETSRDKHGKVEYVDTGYGSLITPPVLTLPSIFYQALDLKNDKSREELGTNLDLLYVGDNLLQRGVELREEYADWLKEKRGTVSVVTEAAPVYTDDAPDFEPMPGSYDHDIF